MLVYLQTIYFKRGRYPLKKDEALGNTEILPVSGILAAEIVEQLEVALEEFRSVEDMLGLNRNWYCF